jgi:hypothetical protein
MLGAKFCSSCGTPMTSLAQRAAPQHTRTIQRNDYDEDGIPTTFIKPQKLVYEIEKSKNKFSVSEIISVPPSEDRIRTDIDPNFRIPTKEEYLRQSMSECKSMRTPKDIDET